MKYSPGLMVGQLSRSVGSTTASHNRFGSYFRARVVPVNPNTTIQAAQRTALAGWSNAYRALTSAQRAGWANLGSQITRLDSLGNSYTLTGLQAYVSVNRNLQFIGSTTLSAAPAVTAPTPITSVTVTATSV